MSFSSLDLGAPRDGLSWDKGCKERLGMQPKTSLICEAPTLDQLAEFFRRMPDWVYLSGHFYRQSLYNNEDVVPYVNIDFRDDGVEATVGNESRSLRKSAGNFQLDQECTLLVVTGCSALKEASDIQMLRRLFDCPVLLGYAGGTGWRISDAMLGGDFIRNDFFARVKNKLAQNDRHAARNAWMETAAWGYGGGVYEEIFRAVDQDGQEWRLSGKTVVKGRKHA